jgi:hypothetical protein
MSRTLSSSHEHSLIVALLKLDPIVPDHPTAACDAIFSCEWIHGAKAIRTDSGLIRGLERLIGLHLAFLGAFNPVKAQPLNRARN